MNNEQNIASNICTISDHNLEAVLFSEFSGTENMIITSDSVNNLSELDGTLCYDETTNELVYVNAIQSNLSVTDSLSNATQSVFAALGEVSTLTEATTFNDGNPVMLLANGSIVIPNNTDDDLAVAAHTNSLFLQFVPNPSEVAIQESSKCTATIIEKPSGKVFFVSPQTPCSRVDSELGIFAHPIASCDEYDTSNDPIDSIANLRQSCRNIDADDVLNNPKSNYRCELCSMTFSRNKEYQTHMLSHKDKVLKCSHCGLSFNKLKNLILHEALHNPSDTTCPLSNCKKKFRRLASLKAHLKLHEEDDTLTCSKCGEEFRNQMCLELHYKSLPQCRLDTLDVNDSFPNIQNANSKLCKLCNRKFQDLSAFIAHKKEHEKIKKALATKSHRKKSSSSSKQPSSRINRCKVCPKFFLKPSQLVRHMRIHTGERPYECTECNKAFNQANSLKIHMLKHTGDRPYLCQFCQSGFSQRGNLRQHINRVHSIPKVEDLVYECSECSCRFKKICSLNAHRNRVHRKGYKLVLSSDEVENEVYLSGQRKLPTTTCTSPNNSNDGEIEQTRKSPGNKKGNHMYMCPECTSTFKTVTALKKHLNEVHIQLRTPQDEGENSITLENDLDDLDEEEMENLLKKRSTVNTIMIAVDRGGGELWNQKVFIKKNGNCQLYQCSHCPKESLKLNEMIRHTKINVMGKLFKCEFCQKTFSQHSTFKTHLSLHATAKAYQCQICQLKFSNPAELNTHSKSHSQMNDDVICMTCLGTYSSKEREKHQCFLTRTFLDVTSSSVQKTDSVAQVVELNDFQHVHDKANLILPPYECMHCNITFKSYAKLKFHLQDHYEEMTSPCDPGDKSLAYTGAEVQNESSKCDEASEDSTYSTRRRKRERSASVKIDVMGAQWHQSDESVLGTGSAFDVPSDSAAVNDISNLDTNDAAQNDISDFVMSENEGVSLNIDQSINYLNNVSEDFAENETCTENISAANDNDQITKYDHAVLDSENRCKKNDVLYTMTTERVGNCFVDSQVTTLPVEGEVAQTEPVFNMTGDIIYKCTSCNEQYSRELDLQKHFQQSEICNNGMPDMTFHYFYACNTCYLTFKSLNSFLRHLQTHNGSGTYACIYCDRPNKTEAELTQHIAAHALKQEYPCVHCGELAETAEAVKKHIIDVHLMSSADSKALETKRKKTISSELLLTEKEKLMLVDHKPNKYSSISEKVLSSLLKKNIRNEDGSSRAEEMTEETEPSSKAKKKRTSLNAKENKCNYCDRSFKKMCDLIRHVRIHTGEKPFKCDYCHKCFTVKSILNCHLKTHFTVKNIFCHICNRFFSTVGSLKIHMRLHTGDRPYQCSHCKECFRTSGHRDSHQKRHLGDKDKTKTVAIEASMVELGDHEISEVSLGEEMNLQDDNFLISKITDIEDFKFHENTSIDLVTKDTFLNANECRHCRRSFKRKYDLEKHIKAHHANEEFSCSICSVRFSRLDLLKAHVKRHSPSPLIDCDVCQETFTSASTLKSHKLRQHAETLDLPFQDDNESFLLLEVNDKSNIGESSNASVYVDHTNARSKSKWSEQDDLNLSVLVGKNKKTDPLSDFFIMEKQFDLNSMISDFFPDE